MSLQKRIQTLQKTIDVSNTGVFDLVTTNAFLKHLNIVVASNTSFLDRKKALQKYLGFTGKDIDGIVGPLTVSRLELLFSTQLPVIPAGASLIASKKSLNLIVESEVSSRQAYLSRLKNPVLPGEYSGITIGIGYDIGHVTLAAFTADWKPYLSTKDFNVLSRAVGKKQAAARNELNAEMKAISISWETALEVFYTRSMPVWAKRTRSTYPGLEKLPPDAQGAIVSLVYNRGTSLSSADSRKEMRNLVSLIAKGNLKGIANEIRAMKRLWSVTTSRGLHIRRDKEADLVENATFVMMPDTYIFI